MSRWGICEMKKPKIVMANSVSLDGSFDGFKVDVRQHFNAIRGYWEYMVLNGSRSVVKGGDDFYGDNFPAEEESDFIKPDKGPGIPYWVVPDTGGITQGRLHTIRSSEFCRDVIVLVSEKTSHEFIDYLEERHYDYLVCGEEKADLVKAFDWLVEKYGVETMMVDAGPTLNGVLIEQGLLDEIILLVHPVVVGGATPEKLLNHLTEAVEGIKLELLESTEVENGLVLLHYKVVY